jgi:1-deoxy-D-xylulose-5-phosphate reductoisomerase
LDFEPPDRQAFPCLDLAFAAGREGETAPAWLSAANEVAVEAFLDGALSWVGIAELLAEALESWTSDRADDLEAVLDVDRRARVVARSLVAARS